MHVTQLWRFPVKSMGGESLASAHLGDLGIEGDRGWGVFDVTSGTVLTARRSPQLLFASARLDGEELVIDLPEVGEVDEQAASAALSKWLGQEVELRRAGNEGGTYEVPLDFENDANWVSWTGPEGAWHDSKWSRVSLVSDASLGDWDIRRFRTNIVVDGEGEDDFVGDHVRLGGDAGAELAVCKQIDRCVMITRPQPGLERDIELLKHINAERKSVLSVGALIAAPGPVAVGDEVQHLPAASPE